MNGVWAKKFQSLRVFLKRNINILFVLCGSVFLIAVIARLSNLSSGLDQWDVVLYNKSLIQMSYFREAQWPLLLVIQKGIWNIFSGLSSQQVLSLTNIILGALTLSLFFATCYKVTKSYISSGLTSIAIFFMPLFATYSIVGMQDIPQTFAVMLYVWAIVHFCITDRVKWLYSAALFAGLALGMRMTLILILPSLMTAALLSAAAKRKDYLKIIGWFAAGALPVFVINQFVPGMPNAQPVTFFLNQFRFFNPNVIGYGVKAGDYALLSGYRLDLSFWLPTLSFIFYLIIRRKRKFPSIAPAIALISTLVFTAIGYGVALILKRSDLYARFAVFALVVLLFLIIELRKLLIKRREYTKSINSNERAIITLATLLAAYLTFNYVISGPVARYFLPVLPVLLLLWFLLLDRTGWKTWWLAAIIFGVAYWARPFSQTQTFISAFRILDPRSSVAKYVNKSEGTFYDFDGNHTLQSHLETYGAYSRIKPSFQEKCETVLSSESDNYFIFYGEISQEFLAQCDGYSFTKVATYQRNEYIIEDSLGNIGYTIYRVEKI